jgi:UDP-N-acetyl-D-mannosaminuronate dehydrogenase
VNNRNLTINALVMQRACNTKWNIKILEARDGIFGHCLSKDVHYLIDSSRNSKLLKTAVSVDKKCKKAPRTKNCQTIMIAEREANSHPQKDEVGL